MPNRIAQLLFRAALGGALCLLLLHIPFLGAFTVGLLSIPMCELVPREFCQSGQHVSVGFAWITFNTVTAAIVYWAYYSVLALAFLLIRAVLGRSSPPPSNAGTGR
jgi:hypothetical protein